jgi:hypothetical protein
LPLPVLALALALVDAVVLGAQTPIIGTHSDAC